METRGQVKSHLLYFLTFTLNVLDNWKSVLHADLHVHSIGFHSRSFKLIYKTESIPFSFLRAFTDVV